MGATRKGRMAYMDLAKFMAIALVCIGHAYYLGLESESTVFPVIYSFHMSLFMMMCGFFSSSSYTLPLKEFLLKKCKQLLVPSITVSVSLAALAALTGASYVQELYGGVWFLKSLFVCYIVTYIGKALLPNDVLACAITSLLLLIMPYGGSLMINYYLLFFWAGYFLKKYYSIYDMHITIFTIISLMIFILFVLLDKAHEVDKVTLQALKTQPLYILTEYVIGLAGALACLGICRYICFIAGKFILIEKLVTIGKYTLGIYVVQTFVLERLAVSIDILHITETSAIADFLLIPTIGIFFTLLSYYIVRMTCQEKWVNILVYGGQYSKGQIDTQ
jgi:fucose 4-O-acetylase-like acetyltransferase